MGLTLLNCSDEEQVIVVSNDLSGYEVVSLEEYPGQCWTIGEEVEDSGSAVTVENCYQNCEDCQRIVYILTDCTGRLLPRYTKQENFSELVGRIVKVPYYNNACFSVEEIQYSTDYEYEYIDYSYDYATCVSCRQRKTAEPNQESVCDPEKVLKISSGFSEALYKEVVSKVYGVKSCCPGDFTKWAIKNWLLEAELLNHPSPDFPEPIVQPCCIDTQPVCTPCSVPVVSECPCKCQASVNTPHDCHLYTFTVISEMLLNAVGNEDTRLNGRVFFGYIPCGSTDSETVYFDEITEEQEYCVIGIPILGWFRDNEWVDSSSIPEDNLVRGEVCEAPDESLCSPCNTCN